MQKGGVQSMSILILIFGLVIGSFLNVCVWRIPRGESIAYPPSHCTGCGKDLKPMDLVPVLSYLLYMGKCRYCGGRISPRYPMVELLNGVIYLLLYQKIGLGLLFVKYAILSSLLIVAGFIDYDHQIIPDRLIIFGLGTGVIFAILSNFKNGLIDGLIGLLIGGGFFLLIAVATNGAMGGGDIKLMAVLGLWLGWKHILLIIFLSFVIGGLLSTILLGLKLKGRKDFIAFGPFIAIAAFIAIYYGRDILEWYLAKLI